MVWKEKGAIIFIMFNWIGKRNITASKTNRSASQSSGGDMTLTRRKTVNDVLKRKNTKKIHFILFIFRFECISVCFVLKLRLKSYDNEHWLCQTHMCLLWNAQSNAIDAKRRTQNLIMKKTKKNIEEKIKYAAITHFIGLIKCWKKIKWPEV